jgi:hypothetical protein
VNQVITGRWWRVPVDQVHRAASHEAQVQWLFDWWQRVDAWISQQRPAAETSGRPAPRTPASQDRG